MPVLVRAASRDQAVPPWFARRMARHLREEGANVTFQELDQPHWWWDSKVANDGGVMHDPEMRDWTTRVAASRREGLEAVLEGGELVVAASSPEYRGRFGLRVVQRVSPASRAFLRVRRGAAGISVRSANVQRFALEPGGEMAAALAGLAVVDGSRVPFDAELGAELCRSAPSGEEEACPADGSACGASADAGSGEVWRACAAATGAPPLSRGADQLGPIRAVFGAPWAIVIADEPSALEVRLAAYFSTGHLVALETATQVLTLSRASYIYIYIYIYVYVYVIYLSIYILIYVFIYLFICV